MDSYSWRGAMFAAWAVSGAISSFASFVCFPQVSFAQNAIAPDKTLPVNTVVNFNSANQTYTITGGTQVGANQFHSFRDLSVPTANTAHFDNALTTANVIGRVTGSNISNIDGTLRTNGSASLYLINPNGIIFGANAKLDIGGSFGASTANSFKFPDGSEFSATNPQAPPLLQVSMPLGLQYGKSERGATITNRGNLSTGQDVTLAADQLDLQGRLQAGRDLTLQAQDTVKIQDTGINPFVASAGRNLLVQGNQSVDIFTLNHLNSGFWSGGDIVLRSPNSLSGDSHYWSIGNFRVEQLDGSLGKLISLNDPVIRTIGDISIGSYFGASLHIFAGGQVQIPDFIYVFGSDTLSGIVETVPLSDGSSVVINGKLIPTIDIRAGINPAFVGAPFLVGTGSFFPPISFPPTPTSADIVVKTIFNPGGTVFLTNQYQPNQSLPGSIQVEEIYTTNSLANAGSVEIDSKGSINLAIPISAYSVYANGGKVNLIANENITVAGIDTPSFVSNAGNVSLLSRNGNIDTRLGEINASTGLQGINGGRVMLTAGLDVLSGSINATGGKFGSGNDIAIDARSVFVTNGAQLLSSTFGQGNAGNLSITATDSVFVTNGAQLISSTYRQGNAGNISITATNSVLFNKSTILSGVGSIASVGKAGNVSINAGSISFKDRSVLSSSTFGQGNAGNITINATGNTSSLGSVSVTDRSGLLSVTSGQGNAGNVSITATDSVLFSNFSVALSTVETGAIGKGGDININARSVSIKDRSLLSSSTNGQGNAGNINITGIDSVSFAGSIASSGVADDTVGKGGAININARILSVTGGFGLSSSTLGQGDAGNINIILGQSLILDGEGTLITASTTDSSTGKGGSIFIDPPLISITNGAGISVKSLGTGNGGNLTVFADKFIFANNALINANTSSGEGGNINLQIADIFFPRNHSQITATAGNNGNGGNINLSALFLVSIPSENNDIFANASFGKGGNINITTQALFGFQFPQRPTPLSDITASSEFGVQGNVNINTLGIDPSKGLSNLPANVSDPSRLVTQRCSADRRDSSFTITGKGGVPANPSDRPTDTGVLDNLGTLPDRSQTDNLTSSSTPQPTATPDRIVEATGWIVNAQNQVELVAGATPTQTNIPCPR